MLSAKNVGAHQASTYYSKDDYYIRQDGEWQGNMKEILNLPDQITPEDYQKMIDSIIVDRPTRTDRENRVGYDLCFSAPKSVSMAAMVDDKLEEIILQAHEAAITETLKYIEEREIYAQVQKNNKITRERTGNMICGKFNHFVSREQDPDIHTHCVIFNQTICKDGKVRAIRNEELYRNKLFYGLVYRNSLASKLQEQGLAIEITDKKHGFFELEGVSRKQIEAMSKRRQQIEEKLKFWDKKSAKDASRAALVTRKAKENKDLNLLKESWRETFKEIKFKVKLKNRSLINDTELKETLLKFDREIGNQNTVFTEKDYKTQALKNTIDKGGTLKNIEAYFQDQIKNNKLIYLGKNRGQNYFCTKEGFFREQDIFQTINAGKGKSQKIDPEYVLNYMEYTTLTPEQRQATFYVCTNSDRYCAVQGLAGVGKTFTLNHIRQIFEDQGFRVNGAAAIGKASYELHKGANILDARTLHSFLNSLEKEAGTFDINADLKNKKTWNFSTLKPGDGKDVWIVDEASLIDNNLMRELVKAAEAKNANVIFTGDRFQMPSVGPGDAYGSMIKNNILNYTVMQDIQRQKNSKALEAVKEAVNFDPVKPGEKSHIGKSLNLLNETTKEIKDKEKRLNEIAGDFVNHHIQKLNKLKIEKFKIDPKYQFTKKDLEIKSMIVTAYNVDREYLNDQVREGFKENGLLPEKGKKLKVQDKQGKVKFKEFAVGDRIVFLQNATLQKGNPESKVMNGFMGYIIDIRGQKLKVENDKNQVFQVDLRKYNYIDHGYAFSTYKIQGATVDNIYVHIDTEQRNSRNAYYVDISRGKYNIYLYTNDKEKLEKSISKFIERITTEDFKNSPNHKKLVDEYLQTKGFSENIDLFNKFKDVEYEKPADPSQTNYKSVVVSELPTVTLLEHGPAPFKFDPKAQQNYYLKYLDRKGNERIVWGIDLDRAITESGVKKGQDIKIENLGSQPVEVKVPIKDENDKIIDFETIQTHRNKWNVTAAESREIDPSGPAAVNDTKKNPYDLQWIKEIEMEVKSPEFKNLKNGPEMN